MKSVLDNLQACTGCHACFSACPVNAIEMIQDNMGFAAPTIKQDKCLDCKKCQSICPVMNSKKNIEEDEAFACHSKSFERRLKSASGGFFTELAEHIIQNGGIVYGVAYDENWQPRHIRVDRADKLPLLKGSKYAQSVVGDCFCEIKAYLKAKKTVLFSGTPCQVAGLKTYLGGDYCNLICVDNICHGVASPKTWKLYLQEISNGHSVVEYLNRNKEKGIYRSYVRVRMENGKVISRRLDDDSFQRLYQSDAILRDSCYQCMFKGDNHVSDITIGDFWGIENYHRELSDIYGSSCVIVHSEKGRQYWKKVKTRLNWIDSKLSYVTASNPSYFQTTVEPSFRNELIETINQFGVKTAIRVWNPRTIGFYKRRIITDINDIKGDMALFVKKIIKRS